jgi:hypothetical protein
VNPLRLRINLVALVFCGASFSLRPAQVAGEAQSALTGAHDPAFHVPGLSGGVELSRDGSVNCSVHRLWHPMCN